jgi:hypothetical protein
MKKNQYLILVLALINVLLHLLLYNRLECHRDELFYYVLGEHPAAGYATTQPLIGLLSWLLIHTLGYTSLAIKLIPALAGGVAVWLTAQITKELGGRTFAQVLAALAFIITPISLRTFMLYMPVFLDLLCWTFTFLFLLRYVRTDDSRYLVFLGIVAGIGLMSKFLIALLLIFIIISLIFTKHRKTFTRKQFYYGLAACFVIFLPNLVWQIKHDFPVIGHMEALNHDQLVYVSKVDFIIQQFLMPYAASFLTVAGLIFLLLNRSMKDFRFIGIVCLLVVIALFMLQGKPYYTQAVYPFLIAAGAVFWEIHIRKPWIRFSFITLLLLITVPVLPIAVPVFKTDRLAAYYAGMEKKTGITAGRRFEDGTIHTLPQDFADMTGWEELVQITSIAYNQVPDKQKCFIYAENYGQASAISILGRKYGLPEAQSFHDSYLYWTPDTITKEITSFIYINDELGSDVAHLFADVRIIGRISNINAREYGTTVYLCEKPVSNFSQFLMERIYEERKESRYFNYGK